TGAVTVVLGSTGACVRVGASSTAGRRLRCVAVGPSGFSACATHPSAAAVARERSAVSPRASPALPGARYGAYEPEPASPFTRLTGRCCGRDISARALLAPSLARAIAAPGLGRTLRVLGS